jgi:uncharacterized hydrophobic protein (TIGR00271 family)
MLNCLKTITEIQKTTGIVSGLTLSSNGIIFIIIGSIIAGFGLFYNNYAIILGSMLISPIGNSILRYSVGYIYGHLPFIGEGVQSILAQIAIGITFGYLMGTINNQTKTFNVPTKEMEDRTLTQTYMTDFTISLLCGFIFAYSVLYNQTSALVGLSVCVSVLVPLVNSGIYTAIAHNEKDIDKYNENMTKALKTFILAILNIIGISFTCMIGFYIFC